MFIPMLRELNNAQILTDAEMTRLKVLYTSTRTPLQHAITGRLIRRHPDNHDLFEDIDTLDGSRDFEEVVEGEALSELEELSAAIRLINNKQRHLPSS